MNQLGQTLGGIAFAAAPVAVNANWKHIDPTLEDEVVTSTYDYGTLTRSYQFQFGKNENSQSLVDNIKNRTSVILWGDVWHSIQPGNGRKWHEKPDFKGFIFEITDWLEAEAGKYEDSYKFDSKYWAVNILPLGVQFLDDDLEFRIGAQLVRTKKQLNSRGKIGYEEGILPTLRVRYNRVQSDVGYFPQDGEYLVTLKVSYLLGNKD